MSPSSEEKSIERYQILERIAGGGMGRIYRGVKKGIGGFQKPVVLKQLLPELTNDPELVDLFFREAQIHATLDHANIVHIIDLVAASNNYYIVMEYVRGTDLYRILKRLKAARRRLTLDAVLFISREMLKALDYAHTRTDDTGWLLRIVHRDVSPTNIMISGAGEVKLTDFGIAKAATHTSNFFRVKGKAAYMSPEQAMGEELDQRTDIFSAAVCVYELLAGRRPFPSPKIGVAAIDHFSIDVVPPSTLRGGCPEELDDILAKALAVRLENRYHTVTEFLSDLEQVSARQGLYYSTRKLASYLEETLGPDPTTWSDLSGSPPPPKSATGTGTGRPRIGEEDDLVFDGRDKPQPDPFPFDDDGMDLLEDLDDAQEDEDPIGAEVTSLSLPPFPRRPLGSFAGRGLPPPKRSGPPPAGNENPEVSGEIRSFGPEDLDHIPTQPHLSVEPSIRSLGPSRPDPPPPAPAGVVPPPVIGPSEAPSPSPSPSPSTPPSSPLPPYGASVRSSAPRPFPAPSPNPPPPKPEEEPNESALDTRILIWGAVGAALLVLFVLIFWMVVKAAGS